MCINQTLEFALFQIFHDTSNINSTTINSSSHCKYYKTVSVLGMNKIPFYL